MKTKEWSYDRGTCEQTEGVVNVEGGQFKEKNK